MEVVVEGLTGPAAGNRFEIADGGSARFGRGEAAQCVIAKDTRMSGTHFLLSSAGERCGLRDLDSTNGTSVNGRRVKQTEIRHGDIVTAGESTFRIRLVKAEEWAEATPAQRELMKLLYGAGERVYAVLDAAREDRIPAFLQACDAEHVSLYEGKQAVDLKSVAPYVASVPKGSKLLRLLLNEGWGKSWGVYLTAAGSLPDVRRHLQQFLAVKDQDGRPYFFRFYDPRVLRATLPGTPRPDQNRFFGPIARFVLEDQDPAAALEFRNTREALQSKQVPLVGHA